MTLPGRRPALRWGFDPDAGLGRGMIPEGRESLMPQRIAVILAGGRSMRMGVDKAAVSFQGERLIDRVVRLLRPQADRIVISGPSSYGLDLESVADLADAPAGPAAGVLSLARRLEQEGEGHGFVTAPVDGPFLPPDLVTRLTAVGGCAAAAHGANLHPTFAYWSLAALQRVEAAFVSGGPTSLMRLASLAGAARVEWPDGSVFANINSRDDLARLDPDPPS